MKFTTKSEYGIVCLTYLVQKPLGQPVTTTEIVAGEGFSKTFTEKILQKLRGAGIVSSFQGNQGGYVLARPAGEITLRQILEALEGQTFKVFCDNRVRTEIVCNHYRLCGLKPVWQKTRELLEEYFDSVTLETIASGISSHAPAGHVPVKKEAAS